MEKSLKHK